MSKAFGDTFKLQLGKPLIGVLLALCLLTLAGSQTLSAQRSSGPAREVIGPGVAEALERSGEAHVAIALVETFSMRMSRTDLDTLTAEVAAAQEQVLDGLDASEYRVRTNFEAVPAMAGTILSPCAARSAMYFRESGCSPT